MVSASHLQDESSASLFTKKLILAYAYFIYCFFFHKYILNNVLIQNEQSFGLGVHINEDIFSCVCFWLPSSTPQIRNMFY